MRPIAKQLYILHAGAGGSPPCWCVRCGILTMLLSARADDIKLFGFGALLHPSKVPTRSPAWEACIALDHAMSFSHNGGYASLVDLQQQEQEALPHTSPCGAHGVVYAMRPFEVDELIRREKGYDLKSVRVQPILPCGETYEALAFISSPWHALDAPLPTTARYANLILDGAQMRGLPAHWVKWLRSERDLARSSSNALPSRYYATPSRRTAALLAGAASAGLVGVPVGNRLWQCRAGFGSSGNACESFFPSASSSRTRSDFRYDPTGTGAES
jgi:hypothetical protein